MRNPHTVRLDGPMGSLMVTHRVSDLEFTNIENGGFGSGSFTMQRPISRAQLDAYTDVLIFDSRTGKQVGGGRVLTPGRSSSDQGQVANISFLGEGPAAFAAVERPYFLIDQNLEENWVMVSRTTRRMDFSTAAYPTSTTPEEPSLLMDPADNVTIFTPRELVIINRLAQRCAMEYGALMWRFKSGVTDSDWRLRTRMYSDDLTSFDTLQDDGWSTSITSFQTVQYSDWGHYRAVAGFQWRRSNSSIVTDEDTWSAVRDVYLRSRLYGRDRVLRTSGFGTLYVLAGEAFIDWVARCCPTLDIENAEVADGTYHFDQLSWPEGITGTAVLEKLLEMEPGLMWGVFEKQANGLFRTELVERSTAVRYELSIEDGYDESGPADELCNVVYALWTSPAGKPQMTRVPTTGVAPVPDLDARGGYVQSKTLTLDDGVSSLAQATQRGQEYLDAHATIPNGGTLTVNGARRIRDLWTGRLVAPWEIKPGYVGRIAGLSPRTDTLNPDGSPDGSTLVRIVSMNWHDSRATAELQLDSFPLDQYHLIADLMKKRR